ncbi:hypothetical protein Adt_38850 [Abeliophyllum distichum]|uniref:C2 domain-containing protein n=1 Tax=Abeliophyllum distichum TaxID=126358 RepID=A0ABD1Q4D1_9LAMI
MSSGSDDSQNRSDVQTNPSIHGESPLSSSSSEVVGKVNQASPASCLSTPSASWREVSPTVPLKKVGGRKRTNVGVSEMRRSLDKRNAPAARALNEELRRSATEASIARSRITAEELEDLRLSYDIPSSVLLRASGSEERTDDPPEEFVAIYEPAMQQEVGTATDSPNKVHNWKERFFFVDGDWEFIPVDPLLHVSIPRRFRELDCKKPPIPKRNQGELRSKWDKVRALSSEFRSLNNLLKDDNLLASCGLMAFRFKGIHVIRIACPASGDGSSTQASRQEVLGPSQEAQDAAPLSIVPPLRPEVDVNVPSHPPSSSNLHIDSTTSRDKGKKVVERVEEAPSQKRKTLQPRRSLCVMPNHRIRISERREELPASVMEMLPVHPSIVAASVHRYWTSSWEKVAEEATILERLQLAEVNLVRGLVLAKDIFSAFVSFDAEDFKSKKLVEDLKVMGLEKAQLESDKRALQFKLVLVVLKETNMKVKYEIKLQAAKEYLKQARDQRRAAEASQKRVEDRTLEAETALAAANSSLEAAAADNERSLSVTKLELEKIKAERADAEARAVEVYQDAFVDTPEYQDLAQCLMTVGGEQLVERIMEAHPEWDISFLREASAEAHVSEADPGDIHGGDEGPSFADP